MGSTELAFLYVCLFVDAAETGGSSASPGASFPIHDDLVYLLLSTVEEPFHSQ